jgi:hypothetical protein
MIIDKYLSVTGIDPKGFVYGKGKRKTQERNTISARTAKAAN